MKKYSLAVFVMIALSINNARAQSLADAITQLVLDYEKLTELKTILQDMYKNYQTVRKGYEDIRNIAEGNFNLHKLFLDGLLAVSPAVKNYARVADILNTEYTLVSEYKAAYKRFNANGHFTVQELGFISKLYGVLFRQSEKDLDELALVITPEHLRMSDAERLSAIDRIYQDMTGNLRVLRSFNNGTAVQGLQRARDANDIGTLKRIYGIAN